MIFNLNSQLRRGCLQDDVSETARNEERSIKDCNYGFKNNYMEAYLGGGRPYIHVMISKVLNCFYNLPGYD